MLEAPYSGHSRVVATVGSTRFLVFLTIVAISIFNNGRARNVGVCPTLNIPITYNSTKGLFS